MTNPPWVNKLLFPPAIKNKRTEPPMTDRLAALKNSTFGGFASSLVGRYWHSNVHEWLILTVNLQKVISLFFLHIVDNNLALI
jgi:hypothetical protein